MNQSEQAALEWLKKEYKYADDDFVWQKRANPDFLTADGRGWEVKLIRKNTATFFPSQMNALRTHPDLTIVFVDLGNDPPVITTAPFKEVTVPGYWHYYRMILASPSKYPVNDDLIGNHGWEVTPYRSLGTASDIKVLPHIAQWINDYRGRERTTFVATLARGLEALQREDIEAKGDNNHITVNVSCELLEQLRQRAFDERVSVNSLIIQAIAEMLRS